MAVLLGLFTVLVGAGAFGVSRYLDEVLTEGSRLRLLLEPPSVARARGIVHGVAKVAAAADAALPPCAVEYRRQKTTYRTTVHDGARLELLDGAVLAIPAAAEISFVREPRGRATPAWEGEIRARLELPERHDATIRCAAPGETVYVEGCIGPLDERALVPCDDDGAVLVSAGRSLAPLVQRRAGAATGWLGLSLASLAALLSAGYSRSAFRRPIVERLATHARETAHEKPPRDFIGFAFVGTVLAFAIAALSLRGGSAFYAAAMLAVLAVGLLVVFLVAVRFRRLGEALRVIRRFRTTAIAETGSELSELAVRVSGRAQPVEAPAGSARPAFVRLVLREVLAVRGKKGAVTEVPVQRARLSYPRWLPVEDASGEAFIDMQTCHLDAEPEPPLTAERQMELPAWAMEAMGKPLEPAENHRRYVVAWSRLEPGDPLLIYGSVERLTPSELSAAARPDAGYRSAPVNLGVRGETVAFRGEEDELERALRGERRVIVPVAALLVAASAATVAACLHAATLV